MTSENKEYDTWVYHALHEAKVVKSSDAEILFKKGWRDSPDPKILFQGFRGKWYWLILAFKKLINSPKKLSFTELLGVIGSIASIIGLVLTIALY